MESREAILLERLNEYGADTKGAMHRLLDDASFYEACLNMLLEDDSFAALGKALHAGDCKRAFEAAHTLKGVTANLGLDPMLAIVVTIVEPLREGRCDDGLLEAYDALLKQRERIAEILA